MFGIGILELIIIFIVILVAVGPEKLPSIARSIAKYVRDFRQASDDLKRTVMSVDNDIGLPKTNDPNLVKRLGDGLLQQFEQEPPKNNAKIVKTTNKKPQKL